MNFDDENQTPIQHPYTMEYRTGHIGGPPRINGFAIASLSCGLLIPATYIFLFDFRFVHLISIACAILAIVMGHIAFYLHNDPRRPEYTVTDLAWVGVIFGWLTLAAWYVYLFFFSRN